MMKLFTTAIVMTDQTYLNQCVTRTKQEKESAIKLFLSLELVEEAYESPKSLL